MRTRATPVAPLTVIAWRLADLPLTDLWWRYIALGGTRPRPDLAAHLTGTAAWPGPEHNTLAQALNEGLWDQGHSSLAPYRHIETDRSGLPPRPGQEPHDTP